VVGEFSVGGVEVCDICGEWGSSIPVVSLFMNRKKITAASASIKTAAEDAIMSALFGFFFFSCVFPKGFAAGGG